RFKKKTDMDGILHTYKAYLVAKGYTYLYGLDYEETFSPITDIRAIRILIFIAVFYDYEIWQMDVKTAFLNGYLDEDIYMVQPEAIDGSFSVLVWPSRWLSTRNLLILLLLVVIRMVSFLCSSLQLLLDAIAPAVINDRQLPFEYTITSRSIDVVVMAHPVQNINHSAFRSIFEREKLFENNFNDWFRQLKLVSRVKKKMYVIEQSLPAAPAADSAANVLAEWNAIYDAYNEVACLILDSMTPELHRQFENSSPYDMMQELKSMFEKQAGVERFDLIQTSHACKQEEGLTKDFAGFVRNYNMHNMEKTIDELHAMLIEYEKGLPKKAETPQVMMIKGEYLTKDNTCNQCKEVGHWKRNCHVYLAVLLKKKKQVGSASSSSTVPSNGIYEIDMHDLVPNVNSIYNVSTKRAKHNLNSTYLWHCRFAHISKKRIENLQQEGILKSTDDESFDQCDYALESATRILNMVPNKKVDKTPYELWIPKGNNGLLFLLPPENKIVVAMYAEFFEKNLITQEVSGRVVDLEEIQDKDTSPSKITSEIPLEVEGFEPPQKEVISIRRSVRTHQAPDRLCLNVDVTPLFVKKTLEDHSLGDLNEPASYKAAMLDSKSNKWLDAMNVEIQSMIDKMVLFLVNLHHNCKTVRTMFYDYEIWQMDVKTAFLNGYLDEDIYMVQPEDDIIIMENHIPSLKRVRDYLGKCFAIKDLREAAFILGIKIYRDRSKRLIGLGQNAYMDKILKRYEMDNSKHVDWKSSKQSTTAISATEAEYIAAPEAAMEAIWIRNFISGLGIVPTINEPVRMFCDNAAELHFANEPGVQRGARHYHRRYHYVRESIALGEIRFLKVHTYDNLDDPFTKALSNTKLTQHARNMGLRLASSFMDYPFDIGGYARYYTYAYIEDGITFIDEYKDKGSNESDAKPSFSDISKATTCMLAKPEASDASYKAKVQACGSKAKLQTSRSKAKLQRSRKTLIVKNLVPITNGVLGLANAETWDAILSKTFGVKIPPTMACAEEKKGKRKISRGS
nr:hypothetical protein [Tanacetum cinerariifolium]